MQWTVRLSESALKTLEKIMYRLGWPCASIFAEMGVPLLIKVEIIHDNEANVYVATSPDLKGLIVEAETLDELEKEVWDLVPELITLDKSKLREVHLVVG